MDARYPTLDWLPEQACRGERTTLLAHALRRCATQSRYVAPHRSADILPGRPTRCHSCHLRALRCSLPFIRRESCSPATPWGRGVAYKCVCAHSWHGVLGVRSSRRAPDRWNLPSSGAWARRLTLNFFMFFCLSMRTVRRRTGPILGSCLGLALRQSRRILQDASCDLPPFAALPHLGSTAP